jgi:hypothetical protein
MLGPCVGVVHLQQQGISNIYILDLLGAQDVRWDKGGTERAGEYSKTAAC